MGNRQCPFCIIKETDPNRVLYEDDKIIIFRDRSPVADIHLQCIPKSHIKNKNYLTKNELILQKKIFQNYLIQQKSLKELFQDWHF